MGFRTGPVAKTAQPRPAPSTGQGRSNAGNRSRMAVFDRGQPSPPANRPKPGKSQGKREPSKRSQPLRPKGSRLRDNAPAPSSPNPGEWADRSAIGAAPSPHWDRETPPPPNPWASPPETISWLLSDPAPRLSPEPAPPERVNPWEPPRNRLPNPDFSLPAATMTPNPGTVSPINSSAFTSSEPMQTVDRRVAQSRRRGASNSSSDRRRNKTQGKTQGQSNSASSRAAQAWGQTTPRRTPRTKLPAPVLYGIRLMILGIGLGVIGGTLLTALDPAHTNVTATELQEDAASNAATPGGNNLALAAQSQTPTLHLNQEMAPLKEQIQGLISQPGQEGLTPGVMVVDLDTGNYLSVNGDRVFATASMIKIPILLAFFEDVDAGKIRLDEELVMRADLVAPHAGEMQYLAVGTKFTALETATEMIRISDNTATNMLIDRLGGAAALNQRFRSWGLQTMTINNLLPDLEGTNVATPKEFALLMELINEGNLLSMRSRDRMMEILRTPVTRTLLPQSLGEGATIAHKTGDIGSLVGDVGIIDMPSGKRYLAAMMVERPHNDNRAQELIRQMAQKAYQYLETQALQSDQPSEQNPLVVPNMLPLDNVATEQTTPPGTNSNNPAMMTPFWSNP